MAAEGGQHRIGPLPFDDGLENLEGERLDVGPIGELGVGHDGGRVGVGQHHPVALLAQHPARLGPGVVELAGLADDDRPAADDQDGSKVVATRHPLGALLHQDPELVEEIAGVVRARTGLGVVLHAEGRYVTARPALR